MKDFPWLIRFIQSKIAEVRLFWLRLWGLPSQTRRERKLYKRIFDGLEGPVRVFEYGAGYSTIYYADYLDRRGVKFEWHTVENDSAWFGLIATLTRNRCLNGTVTMHLREFTPRFMPPMTPVHRAYIGLPLAKGKFDVVLIDGRFRRRCAEVAKKVLTDRGVILMHDAQRPHYMVQGGTLVDGGTWYPGQNPRNKVWVETAHG